MEQSERPSAVVATINNEAAAHERRQASQAGHCSSVAQSFCCRVPDAISEKAAQQKVDLVAIFQ